MQNVQYIHLPKDGSRAVYEMAYGRAARRIGERVSMGFEVVTRSYRDRKDRLQTVVYFQSAVAGNVWAIYDFGD